MKNSTYLFAIGTSDRIFGINFSAGPSRTGKYYSHIFHTNHKGKNFTSIE